jgi:hypothetical protein
VVLGFDQNETKQLLLGLGKGTVGHEDLSASHPHGGRRPNGLEGMSKDEVTARSQHVVVGQRVLREDAHLPGNDADECLLSPRRPGTPVGGDAFTRRGRVRDFRFGSIRVDFGMSGDMSAYKVITGRSGAP